MNGIGDQRDRANPDPKSNLGNNVNQIKQNTPEKALVEYVDALHFQMSLFNYYELGIHERNHDYNNMLVRSTDIIICLSNSTNHCDNILGLSYLFDLGYILGFTWSEIYETYKAKNAVNYERLKNGY